MWGKAVLLATYLLDKIPCKEKKIVFMNYGWEENHPISTYECGGCLSVLTPKVQNIGPKTVVCISLDMLITVVLIISLYVIQKR